MDQHLKPLSRFLSLVLRHEPEKIGLKLDAEGWVDVAELLEKLQAAGKRVDRALLGRVVAENDKQRFALSADAQRIRANQGHSIEIDLALLPQTPPGALFHGTAQRNIQSIRATGLNAGERQHVHLSLDAVTAAKVGARHGTPMVLIVRTGEMAAAGHIFYVSANGVWLTERVPPAFIDVHATDDLAKD